MRLDPFQKRQQKAENNDEKLIYVSFVTRPGQGSEGGVGWQFLKANAEIAKKNEWRMTAVIDERDMPGVLRMISNQASLEHVKILPVPVPWMIRKLMGRTKTRRSYMAWWRYARRVVRSEVATCSAAYFHQSTFGTASLPPVISAKGMESAIWGPVAVPEAPVRTITGNTRLIESYSVSVGRAVARHSARKAQVILAQNDNTARFLSNLRSAPAVITEPNVIVEPPTQNLFENEPKIQMDSPYFVVCGRLIERKRPWIPLNAFKDANLAGTALVFVGDGPMRAALENEAERLGLSDRTIFTGQMQHDDTLRTIAGSVALVHSAIREGAGWVVGEAAALGVPSIVVGNTGAATVQRLSGRNAGWVVPESSNESELQRKLAATMLEVARLAHENREQVIEIDVTRWKYERLPQVLQRAYLEMGKR